MTTSSRGIFWDYNSFSIKVKALIPALISLSLLKFKIKPNIILLEVILFIYYDRSCNYLNVWDSLSMIQKLYAQQVRHLMIQIFKHLPMEFK